MSVSGNDGGSLLLVEEYFSTGDDRFVDELRGAWSPQALAALADRWKRDPRPWARRQIIAYLDLPLDRPGHQPLVKRLFKQAEQDSDDEVMAAFLAAFDRLVRLRRRMRWRYDWDSRTSWQEEELYAPRNSIRSFAGPAALDRQRRPVPPSGPRHGVLFSYHTRRYLRRRAWRYFRRLAHRRPDDYVTAICRALPLYRDADVSRGEDILECWGLVHACFGRHPALKFGASRIALRDGASLDQLSAAPSFPNLWQNPDAADHLFDLVCTAHSRLVRVWATQLLGREHQAWLSNLPIDALLRVLDHDDPEVQQFGAGLLDSLKGIESWPIATWLRLLEIRNPTVLAAICERMGRMVRAERLDVAQCLQLATAEPTPVARLGLDFLRTKQIALSDHRLLMAAGEARSAALGRELAQWVLSIVGAWQTYDREIVTCLFDSLLAEMRQAAWDWLVADGSPGRDDPVLWSRLLETPFDDLRLRLIDHLARRALSPPGVGNDELAPLWCTVLVGVHRGGRQKPKAVAQLAQALVERPERAEALLPVLGAAVRSVRSPEWRAGLSALATVVGERPELSPIVERLFPEIKLDLPAQAAAAP